LDGLAFDTLGLGQDLGSLFENAGWKVGGSRGIGGHFDEGIVLEVANASTLNAAETAAKAVLEGTGLPFTVSSVIGQNVKDTTPHIIVGPPVH
jgi:hypothetical protein